MPLSNFNDSQGLRFHGAMGYQENVTLPNYVTIDTIEIDMYRDPVQTSINAYWIDARPNLANGQLSSSGDSTGWSAMYVDGVQQPAVNSNYIPSGKRVKVKLVAPSSFSTQNVYIFGLPQAIYNVKGALFGITCYLNGVVALRYDCTTPSNVGGGALKEISGNGHYANITGRPDFVRGIEREGFIYNGVAQSLDLGPNNGLYNVDPNKGLTVEAWVRSDVPLNAGGYYTIICNQSSLFANGFWFVWQGVAGGYTMFIGNTQYSSGVSNWFPHLREWHHVVYTYDPSLASGQGKLYIDGQQWETSVNVDGTKTSIPPSTSYHTYIGSMGGNYAYKGAIGETRIYTRGLTAQEVQNNYNGNITRTDLKGEWGVNPDGLDTSGNGRHGQFISPIQHMYKYKQMKAVSFDAIKQQYLTFTNGGDITTPTWTAEFLVNANRQGMATGVMPLLEGSGVSLTSSFRFSQWNANLKMGFTRYGDADYVFANTYAPFNNDFSHIVFSYDGTNVYLYINGIKRDQLTPKSALATCPFTYFAQSKTNYGSLKMGAMRIYTRQLSDSEIYSNYNGQIVRDSNLYGEWFTDGTINDTSGNGRHGIFHQNTYSLFGANTLTDNVKTASQGTILDGISTYLSLPTINSTVTNIVIDGKFDGFDNSYQYFLSSSAYVYRLNPATSSFGSSTTVTGDMYGRRTNFNIVLNPIAGNITGNWNLLGDGSNLPRGVKGTVYSIKLYNDSNLVAHYDFTSGTPGIDISGNGYNATWHGSQVMAIKVPKR